MSYSVVMRHSYETAHRLPHLGSACTSIHGHSWQAAVTVTTPSLNGNGPTVLGFGIFKRTLRPWIDVRLDKGAMPGAADPLFSAFTVDGSKAMRFGAGDDATEAIPYVDGALVTDVVIAETRVNTAIWRMESTR